MGELSGDGPVVAVGEADAELWVGVDDQQVAVDQMMASAAGADEVA